MATYYVNPAASSDGSGTLLSPFNTLAGKFTSSNDVILLCEGTTLTVNYLTTMGNSGQRLGCYEPQTGNEVTDNGRYASIACPSSIADAAVLKMGGAGQTVSNIHFSVMPSAGSTTQAIRAGSTGTSSPTITRCKFSGASRSSVGSQAITMDGADSGKFTFTYNYFSGWEYAIFMSSIDAATNGGHIAHNICRASQGYRSGDEEKFLHFTQNSGTALDWAYRMIVEYNDIAEYGEYGIDLAGAQHVIVRFNEFGAPNGHKASAGGICLGSAHTSCGSHQIYGNDFDVGATNYGIIARAGTGCRVWANRVYSSYCGISNSDYSGSVLAGNNSYWNNTIVANNFGVLNNKATGNYAYNNIISAPVAIRMLDAAGGFTYGNNCTTSANDNEIGATFTNAGGNILTDPMLTALLKLKRGSPCIQQGRFITPGLVDRFGRRFNSPPSIGAVEFRPRVVLGS